MALLAEHPFFKPQYGSGIDPDINFRRTGNAVGNGVRATRGKEQTGKGRGIEQRNRIEPTGISFEVNTKPVVDIRKRGAGLYNCRGKRRGIVRHVDICGRWRAAIPVIIQQRGRKILGSVVFDFQLYLGEDHSTAACQ